MLPKRRKQIINEVDRRHWIEELGPGMEWYSERQIADVLFAIRSGCAEQVERWLDKGINVSIRNSKLETLLHFTCKQDPYQYDAGILNVLKLLIDRGICIDDKDIRGITPLGVGVRYSNVMVFRFLVEIGASVYSLDNEERTLLHVTAERCNEFLAQGIAGLLLSQELYVEARDKRGLTALEVAVRCRPVGRFMAMKHKDMGIYIRMLLEAGADMSGGEAVSSGGSGSAWGNQASGPCDVDSDKQVLSKDTLSLDSFKVSEDLTLSIGEDRESSVDRLKQFLITEDLSEEEIDEMFEEMGMVTPKLEDEEEIKASPGVEFVELDDEDYTKEPPPGVLYMPKGGPMSIDGGLWGGPDDLVTVGTSIAAMLMAGVVAHSDHVQNDVGGGLLVFLSKFQQNSCL